MRVSAINDCGQLQGDFLLVTPGPPGCSICFYSCSALKMSSKHWGEDLQEVEISELLGFGKPVRSVFFSSFRGVIEANLNLGSLSKSNRLRAFFCSVFPWEVNKKEIIIVVENRVNHV